LQYHSHLENTNYGKCNKQQIFSKTGVPASCSLSSWRPKSKPGKVEEENRESGDERSRQQLYILESLYVLPYSLFGKVCCDNGDKNASTSSITHSKSRASYRVLTSATHFLRDFRLPPRSRWDLRYCGILCSV